jgi:hypothetical protein
MAARSGLPVHARRLVGEPVLTPYIRSRVLELVRNRPEATGRTAVVIDTGVAEMVMRLFVNQLLNVIKGRPLRLFTSRDQAIGWLLEGLKE